jgi:hypothetical protein
MDTYIQKRQTGLAVFMVAGPIISMLLLGYGQGEFYLPEGAYGAVACAILLLWSPLPASLPAVLLGDARDRFEPGTTGVKRGLRLMRYLYENQDTKVSFGASIIGFVAAFVLALHPIF